MIGHADLEALEHEVAHALRSHDASGLRLLGHVYVSQAGDYYEVGGDGLPVHERLRE